MTFKQSADNGFRPSANRNPMSRGDPYAGFNAQVQVVDASTLSSNIKCKMDLFRVIAITGK